MMPAKPRFFYGYIIVIISFLIMMMLLGFQSSFGIFFKPILDDFGWTRAETSGVFSLCIIMGGIAGIVMGGLTDRFGPRIVLTTCGLLAGLGYILMWKTQTMWELYLYFGVLIGVGCSVFPPLMTTVARWFVKRRSLMSGLVFAGAGAGMLILPVAIEPAISTLGWRIACLILGIAVLIVCVLGAQFLKRDPGRIGLNAYGENGVQENKPKTESGDFTFREAWHTRQFWLLFFTLVCYGFIFYSIQVHLTPYVTDSGVSDSGAAVILSVVGGAALVGQVGLGNTGDRFGYKRSFLLGLVFLVVSALVLMLVRQLWAFYLVAIFSGLAFGNCSTQESPLIAWLFGLKSHGLILGVFAFSFTIGAAIGPITFGSIHDVTGSYQIAFAVCVALAVIAVVLTAMIRRSATKAMPKAEIEKAV
jgi:MFS family permease